MSIYDKNGNYIWLDPYVGVSKAVMLGLAFTGTSWNRAITENSVPTLCYEICDPKQNFICYEIIADPMDDDEGKLYSPPQSNEFQDLFLHYFSIFESKEDLNEYVKIPLKIIEPNGFFIYAVGFPSDVPGQTKVECYFADALSANLQHVTLCDNSELTGPFFDHYFQDRAFIKQVWWELKLKGHMTNTFLQPEWFTSDSYVSTVPKGEISDVYFKYDELREGRQKFQQK